jgi:hypothetical protein
MGAKKKGGEKVKKVDIPQTIEKYQNLNMLEEYEQRQQESRNIINALKLENNKLIQEIENLDIKIVKQNKIK